MGARAAPRRIGDLICGFCGLGCDDMEVTVAGREVRARRACPEAARLLRRGPGRPGGPRVAGREVPLAEAAATAADLLQASRAAVICGLGADVAGLQGLCDVAVRHGASIDHAASTGLFHNLDTLQRSGWIAATLAEVRNRCDVMLVLGADPGRAFPRFFERACPLSRGPESAPLFLAGAARTVVFLGQAPEPASRDSLAGHELIHVGVPPGLLGEAAAALRGLVEGRTLDSFAGAFGGALGRSLQELAATLRGARYAVLVWHAATLAEAEAAHVAGHAAGMVAALNRTTRAAVFPLDGRDNVLGAHQVMLWRFGYPLRTVVGAGGARHHPALHATGAALADADLLLHVSAFRPDPPPGFGGPVIALAHPETEFACEPDVFIPVGTPGVDHAGHVFRMDMMVCLPLAQLRDVGLPSVAEAAAAILQAGRAP